MNTEKEIALVTGAGRGIGQAIAVDLARDGRHVVANYNSSRHGAEQTQRLIADVGGACELVPFDVTDLAAVDEAVAGIIERHGRIDVLVSNAGIRKDTLMVWMQPSDWSEVIDVNLTGFYNVTRPIIKQMMLQRRGRVVAISSTAGQSGMAGQVNYSASKAGLIGA